MPAGFRSNLLALALGLAGALTFALLHLPLPWLLGALLFTMVSSFCGLPLSLHTRVRQPTLMVLGVAIGAALTPDLIDRATDWWLSLSALVLFLAMASPLAILYCRRIMGFDTTSATFAGIPGGLSEMILVGSSLGGDTQRIALAHATRLAIVLVLITPLMQLVTGLELARMRPGFSPWQNPPAVDVLVLVACAFFGAVVGRAVRLPNPFLLGPLLLSAVVHMTGLTTVSPPNWLLDIVQLLVGTFVGCQFANLRPRDLMRTLTLSTVLTIALIALAGVFAFLLSEYGDLGLAAVMLAFIPGGIAEMCLIAILLQVDPIFVAAHHTLRVLLIMVAAPILARGLRGRNNR